MVRFALSKRLEALESAAPHTVPTERDKRLQRISAALRDDPDSGPFIAERRSYRDDPEGANTLALAAARVYETFEEGEIKDG